MFTCNYNIFALNSLVTYATCLSSNACSKKFLYFVVALPPSFSHSPSIITAYYLMSYQFWELITCPYKISGGFTELFTFLELTQHNYYINVLIPSANNLLGTWLKFSRKTPK